MRPTITSDTTRSYATSRVGPGRDFYPTTGEPSDGRLGQPSGEGRIATAESAPRRYTRMFHARVLTLAVVPPSRPARRRAAAGKMAALRRLPHRLGLRRRAR